MRQSQDEGDWSEEEEDLAFAQVVAEQYLEIVDKRLQQLDEWNSLPERTRSHLRQAEALWPVCSITEDYGDIVVNYGKAVESLLRYITGDHKKILSQFASDFGQPQWLKLFFIGSCPIDRISELVIRISVLRNPGAHADTRGTVQASQASEAYRILFGSKELSAARQDNYDAKSTLALYTRKLDVDDADSLLVLTHVPDTVKQLARECRDYIQAYNAIVASDQVGLLALLIKYRATGDTADVRA